MAVEKLVAVTVAGKLDRFEQIAEEYIYGRDIHLENALYVLGAEKKLCGFESGIRYDAVVKACEDIITLAGIEKKDTGERAAMDSEQMKSFAAGLAEKLDKARSDTEELRARRKSNSELCEMLAHLNGLDADLAALGDMHFIAMRAGHIPQTGYKMLTSYLADMNLIFVKTSEDESDVWGIFFAPTSQMDKAEEILTSLYFVRADIPAGVSGTPKQAIARFEEENDALRVKEAETAKDAKQLLKGYEQKLLAVYYTALERQKFNKIREMAAHSHDFFYIVGYMSVKDAKQLEKDMSADSGIVMVYTEDAKKLGKLLAPPTKLKNNFIAKPFEMFVRMYGLPGYDEIDPTPLLAATYILFFGMMFGDLGQSAVFVVLGFLVWYKKKMELARIVGICGISGMVFGTLYGSVFGKEDIIRGVLPPMQNITTLLISTVAIGAVLIVLAMLLNIRNAASKGEYGEMLFGQNGIAGLVFYVSMLAAVLSVVLKLGLPMAVLGVLMGLAFLCIYLKEPLSALLAHEKDWLPRDAMFYVQSLFEMVEVLLSYFSNTISFLRIGAFAIVHVGMMMAVEMLAGSGGAATVVVTVLGNILVMVLEGLVVGIQVLRLEYYEMFSRYFTGNGREFVSLKK